MNEQEQMAMVVWRQLHGYTCKEPLRTKGGALDPNAWCMEAATAILTEVPLPWLYSDTRGVDDGFGDRCRQAVGIKVIA